MTSEPTFDPKCFDLAEAFLEGRAGESAKRALAAEIQQTIEAFLAELEAAE